MIDWVITSIFVLVILVDGYYTWLLRKDEDERTERIIFEVTYLKYKLLTWGIMLFIIAHAFKWVDLSSGVSLIFNYYIIVNVFGTLYMYRKNRSEDPIE